ncbi:MAG: hypothetical protein ABEJ58_07890 [Halodesulfurarchaeum sp.]
MVLPPDEATRFASLESVHTRDAETVQDDVEIDRTDLKATIVVLGLASVYGVWVAYTNVTAWSIAVAVAAIGSTVYLAALRTRARASHSSNGDAAIRRDPAPSLTDGGHNGATADTPAVDDERAKTDSDVTTDGEAELTPSAPSLAVPIEWANSIESVTERARSVDPATVQSREASLVYLPTEGVLYAIDTNGTDRDSDPGDGGQSTEPEDWSVDVHRPVMPQTDRTPGTELMDSSRPGASTDEESSGDRES